MTHKRIHIDPAWRFRDDEGNSVDPMLFRLLQEIYHHKKLTAAAKGAGLSYRHSWNLLNKWASFFGTPLAHLEKGRGASLTPLGEKLLWAEQRVVARFQPQMANLASELNAEIQKTLANHIPRLRICASHGYAVALLPDVCERVQLDLQYGTPLESLEALKQNLCDLAGLHMPRGVMVEKVQKKYRSLVKSRDHHLIRFISRSQGLMVKPGNPCSIATLQDLVVNGVTFINRNKESGTRALFDQLLMDAGLSSSDIEGYRTEEFTHSAVAAHVAAGMADVGFGVAHAAHLFDLEFIPLCREDYVFIGRKHSVDSAAVKEFIADIQSPDTLEKIAQLAGYQADSLGGVEQPDSWLQAQQ